jgi:nucleotide-binding universal stress UspA family protein
MGSVRSIAMFRSVLLAFDGSAGSRHALDVAADIARSTQGELHVLAVGRVPEYAQTVSEIDDAREQAGRFYQPILDQAVAWLQARGVSARPRLDFGKPGDVILRLAEELSVDLIVLGTNPHSALRRRVLGATVDKVVDHAHCSVLVVRSGESPAGPSSASAGEKAGD